MVFGDHPLGGLPCAISHTTNDEETTMVIYRPDPTRMRGLGHPYPARKVMVELLVKNHGVRWAGWYSIRNLRRQWDKVNASFFMNKNSRTFQRQWEIDGRDPRR